MRIALYEIPCPSCGDGTIRGYQTPATLPTIPPTKGKAAWHIEGPCPECARPPEELGRRLDAQAPNWDALVDVSDRYRQVLAPLLVARAPRTAVIERLVVEHADHWLHVWRDRTGRVVLLQVGVHLLLDEQGLPTLLEPGSDWLRSTMNLGGISLLHERARELIVADLDLLAVQRGRFDDRDLEGGAVVAPDVFTDGDGELRVTLARQVAVAGAPREALGLEYAVRIAPDLIEIAARPSLRRLRQALG